MSGLRKLLIALALMVAAWLLLDLWNDDSRRIERRLGELQELAAKVPGESSLQGAARAREIADLFASEFELRAEPENFGTTNRQDLIRGVIAYRSRSPSLVVGVNRLQTFLDPGGVSATQFAYVEFINDLGDVLAADEYPVRIFWVREVGDWKVGKLEVLPPEPSQVLSRPLE